MGSKSVKTSILRGKRMRATRLSTSGAVVYGDRNSAVTEGFVSVAFTTNVEEVEAITMTNANGKNCVAEPATQNFTGYSLEQVFCNVDFGLFELITGQELVLDENGEPYGITESTEIKLEDVNWALEIWTGATVGNGYILVPRISGGIISDITVENAGINFTITGAATKGGNAWGKGPYKVETVAGVPSVLRTAMKANDHRRILAGATILNPPAEYPGTIPVLDPADPVITAVDAVVTGQTAALTPTPAGTDPVFYDFGDGEFDYAETGSYSHEYETSGTYTVSATRGGVTVSETVEIA